MSYKSIKHDTQNNVHTITLNRPEAGNSIDIQMAAELDEACRKIKQDKDARAVILTGAGNETFCAGQDLAQLMSTGSESQSMLEVKDFAARWDVAGMIAGIDCPVVAAINGDATGAGLTLALACDLRVASDKACFCVPDVTQGSLLSAGITQLLPRIVGKGKAMEMVLTARSIDAAEAKKIGLVHYVVPPAEVVAEAERLAAEMAAKAPLALRYVKEAVNKGMDLTLSQGLRLECDLYMILHTTRDRIEGITSFREKRPPVFKGE